VFTILRGGSLSWNTASLFFHGQNQLLQCLTCPAYLLIRKFSAARNSSSDASLLIPRRLYGYITRILETITEIKSSSQNRCSRIIITTVTNNKIKRSSIGTCDQSGDKNRWYWLCKITGIKHTRMSSAAHLAVTTLNVYVTLIILEHKLLIWCSL